MYHDVRAVCARFQYYLQDMQRPRPAHPSHGMVVIDERNNQQNKQLTTSTSIYSTTTKQTLTTITWWRACSSQLFPAVGVPADLVAGPSTARLSQAIRFLQCDTRQYPVPPERRRERVWE